MKTEIDRIAERTQNYWREDGLPEIAVGLLFVTISLVMGIEVLAERQTPAAALGGLLLPLIMIGGYFGARRLVQMLKERVTYPRTGYVAYRRLSARSSLSIVVGLATLGLVLAGFVIVFRTGSTSWFALFDGILAAIIFGMMAHGMLRMYLLAAAALITGAGLSALGLEGLAAHSAFFGVLGLLLLASGGLALLKYLSANPAGGGQNDEI